MQKLLISLLFIASLISAGCSTSKIPGVYRPDIQQGNVVTQEMVDKLRPGMTRQQVQYIMGTPLLVDVFHQNRWDYLYSMEPGGGERQQERISIYFEDNRLVRIAGDFRPMPAGDLLGDKETVHTVPDHEQREKGFFRRSMESVGIGSDDEETGVAPQEEAQAPEESPEEAQEEEEKGFFGRMWDKIGFGSDEEE
jgi:outer membrane protein assembly factor BamE